MRENRRIALALSLVAAIAVGACGCNGWERSHTAVAPPVSVTGKIVLYILSDEYAEKVKQFALTPREAAERVVAYHRQQDNLAPDDAVFLGDHYLIVGDEYVFSPPDKRGFRLSGCYVNGNTGDVREVSSSEHLRLSDHRAWAELQASASREQIDALRFPLRRSVDWDVNRRISTH